MHISKLVRKILCAVTISTLLFSGIPSHASDTKANKQLMNYDAVWSYSDKGTDLGDKWLDGSFDYSSWKTGKAPLGFGDAVSETNPNIPLGTEIGFGDDENNKYMTTYFKTKLDIDSLEGYEALEVYIHVDDGAIVYFNGKEAFRKGIDEDVKVDYSTPAKFSSKEGTFTIPVNSLKDGENILSAEVHQDGGDSSDLWFEMSIRALTKAPVVVDYTKTPLPNPDVKLGDISRVIVSFNGDTTTSKGFTWYTNQASIGSDLQVIENKGEEEPDFKGALSFKGSYARSTNAPEYIVHKTKAAGLKPGTEYWFRVGDASLDLWSDAGNFRTADSDGKFTFIDLADPQAKTELEAELSADTFELANETVKDSEFMIINGDIVDTGMNEEQWGWVLDNSDDTLYNTTLVAAAGNHDEDPEAYIEHFNISVPAGSSVKTGAYYSYDYENAHFIILNNNEDSEEYRNFTPEQIKWLETDVKSAKSNDKINWIIAIMHKGPYTTSNHATDDDIMDENGVREKVAPLFNQFGVDLVLQGHDHIYARTMPVKDGEATKAVKKTENFYGQQVEYSVNPDGTIYLIPSTAGPKVYYKNTKIDPGYYDLFEVANEHSAAKYGPDPNDPSRPVRSQIQNFVQFSIDGNKLTGITYEIDKRIADGEPFVVDAFGIIKSQVSTTLVSSEKTAQVKYTVKSGDTLAKIAAKYGTTYQEIQKLNKISNPHKIYPGQVFIIPVKK